MNTPGRPTGAQVESRIREASSCSDLSDGLRLHAKTGMTADAIAARLREVSDLRDLCLSLSLRTNKAGFS